MRTFVTPFTSKQNPPVRAEVIVKLSRVKLVNCPQPAGAVSPIHTAEFGFVPSTKQSASVAVAHDIVVAPQPCPDNLTLLCPNVTVPLILQVPALAYLGYR